MARAVETDSIGNKLPVIVPFNLFEQCIQDAAAAGQLKRTQECRQHEIVPVPTAY